MPGNPFFLDSSYVIALAQANDGHHRRATELAVSVEHGKIGVVTTRAVLLEVGSALAKTRVRRDAIRLIDSLQNSTRVEIVPVTEEIAAQGWSLFRERIDKEWSWTDCISFVVMKERRLSDALTSDQHFEQAGFTALLRH
ncbi:MAG: type II toxin-antitoxin system VapC family toxin [Verrucomicrobia bacterium]|nr:type II toxin-antitoxin system VapC family toxin [Verrucomicrobiota bacterium]